MRALLKGFGWTIWGAIGAGLLIIAVFVGYQAALKFRNAHVPAASDSLERAALPDNPDSHPGSAVKGSSNPTVGPLNNVHRALREAADQHRYDQAIEYGLQIVGQGTANAQDLRVIAQSYLALNDCSHAIGWFEKASEALRRDGQPNAALPSEFMAHCPGYLRRPITPENRERILSLLATVQQRAKVDQENLPEFEADAAASKSGEPYIKLGQLYYGFGEYQKAVVSIEHGLEKGAITHLDDAFICLGRSKVALQDFAGARAAFARLKDVPTISPKVAALWALYGETLPANQ